MFAVEQNDRLASLPRTLMPQILVVGAPPHMFLSPFSRFFSVSVSLGVLRLVIEAERDRDTYNILLGKSSVPVSEFNEILANLCEKKLIYSRLRREGSTQLSRANQLQIIAYPLQKRVSQHLAAEKKTKLQREKAEKISIPREQPPLRTPKKFFAEKYQTDESVWIEGRKEPDCTKLLTQEALIELLQGCEDEKSQKERQSVFNVTVLNAFVEGESVVVKFAPRGSKKSFSEIVNRCAAFGVEVSDVQKHLQSLLDLKIVNTSVAQRSLYFFGTPWLKKDKIRSLESTKTISNKNVAIETPEFVKKFVAPDYPEGVSRWIVRCKCKNIRSALHADSLKLIHSEFDSKEGKTYLQIFDVIAFAGKKDDSGEMQYPSYANNSGLSFGEIVRRCESFSISIDSVSRCVKDMMERKVLFSHVNGGWLIFAAPFLHFARMFDDNEDYNKPNDNSRRVHAFCPDWLAQYARSEEPAAGEIHSRFRLIPNVEQCLPIEKLREMHDKPESDQAKTRFCVFDVIAFGGEFQIPLESNERVEFETLRLTGHATYGQCMRACSSLGIEKEEFDTHLRALLDCNALRFRKNGFHSYITGAPFLANCPINIGAKKNIASGNTNVEKTHVATTHQQSTESENVVEKKRKTADSDTQRKRRRVELNQITGRARSHIDQTCSNAALRFEASTMLRNYLVCDLCGGEFTDEIRYDKLNSHHRYHPWTKSYNVKNPNDGKTIATEKEIAEKGNIVHAVCNFAQNKASWKDVISACELFAKAIVRRDGILATASSHTRHKLPPKLIRQLKDKGTRHNLTNAHVDAIIENSWTGVEHYTGVRVGFGTEYDLDLHHYDTWPLPLHLSLDKIDPRIPDGEQPETNYRVTFLMLNFVKNCYPEEVVYCWLKHVVAKYKDK